MSDGAGLVERDAGEERVIAHVDMDCFYASCERLREPALRGEPLVVGMGYEPDQGRGAVATASYEAREFGVESAMAITTALEKLPRKVEAAKDDDLDVEEAGFYRPVDLEYYQDISEQVKDILHDAADTVREVSIDEAYLDLTGRVPWDEAESFAGRLKADIEDEVGVAASVGVAPNMSAAKIASDHDKPDGLVVVEPGEVRSFLAPLPVEEVHHVGPVTARELAELDIETAGDLAAADPEELEDRFGERGLTIHGFARGEDGREVTPKGLPKSLSKESSFAETTADVEAKRERVRLLAEQVAERADRKDALYQTIGIKVVTPPYDVNTRARSLPGPVEDPDLLESVALDLLEEFHDDRVRKVGVRVSKLSFTEGDQASLDGWGDADAPTETADNDAPETAAETMRLDEFEADGETSASDETDAGRTQLRGQTVLTDFR
ncbi:DNA polymerase IV [Haloarculaceae archaeon H-GB1-1]|nr:DNA polymerase IV [Haloarculaceae archaeon H-GB1-1]